MICRICNQDNNEGNNFCIRCGSSLVNTKNQQIDENADPDSGFLYTDSLYIKPEVIKYEIIKPEVTKPEHNKHVFTNPEIINPEATKSEPNKPEFTKPEVIKPNATKPEFTKPEVIKPEVNKSKLIKPEIIKPELIKSEIIIPEAFRQKTDINIRFASNSINEEPTRELLSPDNPAGNKAKLKLRLLWAFIIIAAIGIITFLYTRLSDKNYKNVFSFIPENVIEIYSDSSEGLLSAFIFNSKGKILGNCKNQRHTVYSPDKTAALLLSERENNNGLSDLYYVNTDGMVLLNSGVQSMCLSDNGKYALYTTMNNSRALSNNYLFLYDTERKQEKFLDKSDDIYAVLLLSPDGKTILYSTIPNKTLVNGIAGRSNIEMETFLIREGGKPEPIDKNIFALAISDGARYIYYSYYDGKSSPLYVKKEDESVLLTENIYKSPVIFNKDYSEVLFSCDDGTYISTGGKEKRFLTNSLVINVIVPSRCAEYNHAGIIKLYGIASFRNTIIQCADNTLNFIDDHYKVRKIGSVTADCKVMVSKDGKNLLYSTEDWKVIEVTDLAGKCGQKTLTEEMDMYSASEDLANIYYTSGGSLYYIQDGEEPKLIIRGVVDSQISKNGKAVFFKMIENGGKQYYCWENGVIKPLNISGYLDILKNWNYSVAFREDSAEGYRLYYNTSGTELKEVLQVKK